jgi:uncharacterized membrane protein
METQEEEKEIYQFFRIGIILKGLVSLGEVVMGTLLFFIPASAIISLIQMIREFLSAPQYNFITGHLDTLANEFTAGAVLFIALYLLSRGLVKVFIIWGLLRNKLWAYPTSLVILSLFVLFQIYQIFSGQTSLIIAITIFDLVVMYFIWREYKIIKAHQKDILR